MKCMWEILVPTMRNDGKPYRLRFHKVWDAKIRAVSGGLTIMSPVKGQWVSPDGTLFAERMIPVRIVCDDKLIDKIIKITMKHYQDQEAILTYKVATDVKLVFRSEL